ncbi:MAG: DUF6655 family protein [Pirellulaceae bacterium]
MRFTSIYTSAVKQLGSAARLWYLGKSSLVWTGALVLLVLTGCGTTKSFTATEQLLLSDAVDATVAKLDFSPLARKKVYFDATYLKTVKSPLLIDSDYVISSLRQQMVSSGVLLVEGREEADIVAEARIGALGMNGHDIVYGVPASNVLSSASAAIAGSPVIPAIPEISLARREGRQGAAKIAVFAYDRQTRQPYWQSGIAKSMSTSKDLWFLGIGPFQKGTIHDGTRFAGAKVIGNTGEGETDEVRQSRAFADYNDAKRFIQSAPQIVNASTEVEADETAAPNSKDGQVVSASSANE